MKIVLILLVLLGGAVVTVALIAGPELRDSLARFKPDPATTDVRIEPARLGTLIETVSAPGEIEPHTDVLISAVVSARIISLAVREGDEVLRGDVICRLDDKELQALLKSAQARRAGEDYRIKADEERLKSAQSSHDFAKRELERIQSLFDTGDVSRRDLDNALERVRDLELSVASSTHQISVMESSRDAAMAEIERVQEGLDNAVIESPMDGVVTRLNVEVGEIVTGSTTNPGTVLMTIANLSRMVLKARVAESDIADVQVGQRAKIYINAYPDDVFGGTVRQIALQRSGAADGTGFFVTEVEVDLQGRRIYSGLVANVEVEIKTHEGLVVPYQAIVARDVDELPDEIRRHMLVDRTKKKTNVVYRVVDGKTACTPIRPGASDLTHRIVLEGLDEGDEIVVGPYKILESIAHDERVSDKEERDRDDSSADDETAEDEAADDGAADENGQAG